MTADAAFHDLPARCFPFTIELRDHQTGTLRWSAEITGPGAIYIPSRDEINGGRLMSSRLRFADGTEQEAHP